jgi:hypothetical protein
MGSSVYDLLKLDDPDPDIRLIELEPDVDISAPVHCRLRNARLNDNPKYSALSYVWGELTTESTVYINGVKTRVTDNLESAMRRIRDGTTEQSIWIDAICIDQKKSS